MTTMNKQERERENGGDKEDNTVCIIVILKQKSEQ